LRLSHEEVHQDASKLESILGPAHVKALQVVNSGQLAGYRAKTGVGSARCDRIAYVSVTKVVLKRQGEDQWKKSFGFNGRQ
jgi:hypothetical protein